jgi:hypothetical protein
MLAPSGVFAYSYGDPNKEDVAETFKQMLVKLNDSNPDWAGALEIYKVRRTEISSHFGESIAVTLDKNIANKEKELLITNYKAVLVLNLKRRFDYIQKDINDYSKVKLLLAKAKGTFDVLQPYVEAKAPNKIDDLNQAFEVALEALGNPGLFGVGEMPVKPEEFKKQADFIYQTVKPLFPYTAYKEKVEVQKPKEPVKESTTVSQPSKTTTPKPTNKRQTIATNTQAKESSTQENDVHNSTSKESSTESTDMKEATEEAIEGGTTPENSEEAQLNDTDSNVAEGATAEVETEKVASETTSEETVVDASKEIAHAPMERSTKTNPLWTILVVGAVVLVGGGSLWFAKKKGFI